MRDIYLIDFENVASEGLSGITYLAPEDEVIIFYSNNSKSLSMKMHILIGKSVCKLDYFEATVGGKNALDHQISTWLGYLVGTNAAERNYYIVSRDMGYKFVASFWADSPQKPNVRCVESIKAASRQERNRNNRDVRVSDGSNGQTPMLKPAEPVLRLQSAQQVEKTEAGKQPGIQQEKPVQEPVSESGKTAVPAEVAEGAASQVASGETTQTAAHSQNASAQVPVQEPEVQQAEAPTQQTAEPEPSENRKNYRGRQRYYHRSRGKNGRNGAQTAGVSADNTEEPANAPEERQPEQQIADRGLHVENRKDSETKTEVGYAQPPKTEPAVQQKESPEEESSKKEETAKAEGSVQLAKGEGAGKNREKPKNDSKVMKSERPQEAKKADRPQEGKKGEQTQEAQKPEQPQEDKACSGEKKTAKPRRRNTVQKTEEPRRVELGALLAPYPGLQEQHLQQLIAENKRQILCNTLRKQLGQEKGLALYNEIKKHAWR